MTDFKEVRLTAITPNPFNPRKHFAGPEFDELVHSVNSKGVIQPILLRPIDPGFEIVAGERRFRAAGAVAEKNGGLEAATIPAVIRDISEDEAFELMTIENLQRKDLTPLEEANSFKKYTVRKGREAIGELAEKTGINPRYIHRRLAVLALPKKVLRGWENEKLVFGHLEQLMRLSDKKDILRRYDEITTEGCIYVTVQRLKANIDNQSPPLNRARFDLEKAGCLDCTQNTDVQKKLWEMDGEKAHCLNPKCFTNHQNDHLVKNWKRTGFYRHHGTKGFRFDHTLSWDDYNNFYGKPPKKCKSCDHFVTIMDICCDAQSKKACVGDKTCFNNKSQSRGSGESSEKMKKWEPGDGPRVSWHGSHFRDHFYQRTLPERMRQIPPDDTKAAQIVLFHLLKQNPEFHGWFITTYDLYEAFDIDKPEGVDDAERYFRFGLDDNRLFSYISNLDLCTVQEITHQLSIKLTLEHGLYLEDTRGYIAKHAGIDLAGEFEITKEYLQKKTMPEILHMGQSLGIFDDQKAEVFMFDVLGKTNGNYAALKKGQLVRVFLESGVDLKGKVPEEILAIDDEEGENHESTSL